MTGNAYYDFCETVRNSWTYERMTEEEQGRCWDALHFAVEHDLLKGAYYMKHNTLEATYHAFLLGLGYTDFNWRDKKEELAYDDHE